MKPYGRQKNLKGRPYKIDYHPQKGSVNWWEVECNNIIPKGAIKHKVRKEIQEQIKEMKDQFNEL